MWLSVVIICGFLLSAYALTVEMQSERAKRLNVPYRAFCDVGMFSCTAVFSSKYGSMTSLFGLPKVSNAAVGMSFYVIEFLVQRKTPLLLVTSGLGFLASIGLFVVLTFVMKDFCFVCFSVYVVNITTFAVAYRRWRRAYIAPPGGKLKQL